MERQRYDCSLHCRKDSDRHNLVSMFKRKNSSATCSRPVSAARSGMQYATSGVVFEEAAERPKSHSHAGAWERGREGCVGATAAFAPLASSDPARVGTRTGHFSETLNS